MNTLGDRMEAACKGKENMQGILTAAKDFTTAIDSRFRSFGQCHEAQALVAQALELTAQAVETAAGEASTAVQDELASHKKLIAELQAKLSASEANAAATVSNHKD